MQTRRYQVEWMLLGTVLLFLGALIGHSLYFEYSRADALERDRLQLQARIVDENLGRQIERVNHAMAGIRDEFLPWGGRRTEQEASRHLRVLAKSIPGLRALGILDAEGTALASSEDELIGKNFSESEFFRIESARPNPDTLYVSPPFPASLGAFSINLTRAVVGSREEFAGVITATLAPEYFAGLLNSVLYTPAMRSSIIHGDGRIIIEEPNRKDLAGMDLAKVSSRYTKHLESGQTGNVFTATAFSSDDQRMSAWRTIRRASLRMDKPLMVSVNRDMADIFASWRRQVYLQSGLFGALLLITTLGLLSYQRRQMAQDHLDASYEAQRKQAELALQESDAMFRYYVKNTPAAVAMFDTEVRYLLTSNRWLTDYRLGERDVTGISHYEVFPEIPERWKEIHRRCLAGAIERCEEDPFPRRDGSLDWVRWEVRPWWNASGAIGGIIMFTEVITERKRVEEALRESEERFRSLTEMSSDFYWESDVEHRLRLRGSNGKPSTVSVFQRGAQLGKRRWEIPYLSPDEAGWHAHRAVLDAHRPFRDFEFSRLGTDGTEHLVSVCGGPVFDATGAFKGYRGVGTDVTERKRTEQALRNSSKRLRNLSQRLIEVEDAVRRKINRELHDRVGANLSALNLDLSILGSQLPQESLRAAGARLKDTQRLLEETTAHVRDLMADLHPPALDDYGLLAALRTYVEAVSARISVPISVQGEDFAPRLPLATETALFRVAQGALANAIAHAQARRIQVLLAESRDGVTLTISDDGIGFDVAQAAQAHASWGLTIMRERAEAVGAELSVESAPRKGTRVCVQAPWKRPGKRGKVERRKVER